MNNNLLLASLIMAILLISTATSFAEKQDQVLEEMEKNKIPATDVKEAEKQAKEVSGREDPFKSLLMEESTGGFRSVPRSEAEGLLLTGVFINGGAPTAIMQRGNKSYYVNPGMLVENLKVVSVEENRVDLISKTGKRFVIKMGGAL